MVYVFASTEAERASLRQSLLKMVKGQYDVLTMVTVDPLEFPHLAAQVGLDPSHFPAGAVHQISRNRIFPYPKDLKVDSDSLQRWGLEVWQSRIAAWAQPGMTTPTGQGMAESTPGVYRATRKVSIANIPGVKLKIGRDEL
jgi:protein disulfide-isomerase A1